MTRNRDAESIIHPYFAWQSKTLKDKYYQECFLFFQNKEVKQYVDNFRKKMQINPKKVKKELEEYRKISKAVDRVYKK